jgi:uncharacterized protein (TIGR01777 family)
MKILLTGATGFVGSKLLDLLLNSPEFVMRPPKISILTRNSKKAQEHFDHLHSEKKIPLPKIEIFEWDPDPKVKKLDAGALDGVNVIIHLAGENIAGGRWSEKRKVELWQSRVEATDFLVEEIKKHRDAKSTLKRFISAGAIGYYGSFDPKINPEKNLTPLTETSKKGEGFLSDLCESWEKSVTSLLSCQDCHVKISILRIGIILGQNGGALEKMIIPFKLGAGGILASGKQMMSWIHLEDLVKVILTLTQSEIEIEARNTSSYGEEKNLEIYNLTAPNPVANVEFTKTLGKVINRPTLFPVPGFMLNLLVGEMAQELLIKGSWIIPQRILDLGKKTDPTVHPLSGFQFTYPHLEGALKNLVE